MAFVDKWFFDWLREKEEKEGVNPRDYMILMPRSVDSRLLCTSYRDSAEEHVYRLKGYDVHVCDHVDDLFLIKKYNPYLAIGLDRNGGPL